MVLPRFLQTGEEERLTGEYVGVPVLEILFHDLVQNIYPIREH
jgi:hypothetical protein